MNTTDIFEQIIVDDKHVVPPILLIDSSGSVLTNFTNEFSVFTKMADIINKKVNSNFVRMVFWNSHHNQDQMSQFVNGVYRPMSVIKKESIGQMFKIVKNYITRYCLTHPDKAFEAIIDDWIDNTNPTHIYLITDGVITNGNEYSYQRKFGELINKLFKQHNNVHLHLITVEPNNNEFADIESMRTMAGADVFKMFQNTGMTQYISEFTSYNLRYQDGYTHIERAILPKGYSEFMNKPFPITKTMEFMYYLNDLIKTKKNSEDELLKIIQSLTITLRYLSVDKSPQQEKGLLNMICRMFNNTVIDETIVKSIFLDASQSELEGKAIVFTEYRHRLKNLYKQADTMLMQSVKNAINLDHSFFSLPYPNKLSDDTFEYVIVSGNSLLISDGFKINNKTYPESSIKVNDILLPVFSSTQTMSEINEQCLRQYIRSVVAKQYKCDALSDLIIYIVLGLMTQVVCSDVDDNIKESFRKLGNVMLNKKRVNTNTTELKWLEEGHQPIPNLKTISEFHNYMNFVMNILKIQVRPMTLWYSMCLALNNPELIVKQLIHCKSDVEQDYPNVNPRDILNCVNLNKVVHKMMPTNSIYEYKCMVTLDDSSSEGGYKIKPHETVSGYICNPLTVFTDKGHELMINNPPIRCVICYNHLTYDSFERVLPKQTNDIVDIFTNIEHESYDVFSKDTGYVRNNQYNSKKNKNRTSNTSPNGRTGYVISMSGTIGSGKSTYSNRLKQLIEQKGGRCVIASPDNYCKQGINISQACRNVGNDLRDIQNDMSNKKPLVVIVDTCGDIKRKDTFGCYFDGWNKIEVRPNFNNSMKDKYLCWTLRNLLTRGTAGIDTLHWLNPVDAGYTKCLEIHKNKSKHIVGSISMPYDSNMNMGEILNTIDERATEYQRYLDTNMNIESEIEKIMNQII